MELKNAIKTKARYIFEGCPKCNNVLYKYWDEEYHCMLCGFVVYGDLLNTDDPRLVKFFKYER